MYQNNQNPSQQGVAQHVQHQQPAAQGFAFTMNEESAMEAGKESYITENGAFQSTIERVQYCQASTGTHGMIFRFITIDGLRGNFIVNYQHADGRMIFGADLINAILYLVGVPGFSWTQAQAEDGTWIQVAKELEGKQVGFVVESVKNMSGEGRHLELRQAFDYITQQSASEKKQNLSATAVEKLTARLTK